MMNKAMEKTTTRTWVVYGMAIFLLIMILVWYFAKMYLEMRNYSSLSTRQLTSDLYVIEDHNVNMFLIKSIDAYIAIDAGATPKLVRREMQKLSIDPLKVKAVFLTHTDPGHVAALGIFTNATIYMSKFEEQMINEKKYRFGLIKNKNISRYKLLDDDQIVDVSGIKVRGIATPGHTLGSMCYVVNEVYLFVGDAMSLKNGKAALFNELFNMDSKTAKESIKKLSHLQNLKYVFTAHYGFSDNVAEVFSR